MRAVHQILPALQYGDAIGNHAVQLRQLLRAMGYESEIFAGNWDEKMAMQCRTYRDYFRHSHRENLLIVHYAVGSDVNRFASDLPDRLVLYYHNITPAHFFYRYNGALARLLEEGRRELGSWAGRMPAIAGSDYNRFELEGLGFRVLGVVPYTLTEPALNGEVEPRFAKHGAVDWLHVGRLAPNKRIEDILKAFAYYHHVIEAQSRLILVGSGKGLEGYVGELYAWVTRLRLDGAVVFTGQVQSVGGYYRQADVYVCMSEHEGFCVPLVEAMQADVPVLAYAATAVPSTLRKAGVLFHQKDYPLIAELAQEVTHNPVLRERLIATQRTRLESLSPDLARQAFIQCLRELE